MKKVFVKPLSYAKIFNSKKFFTVCKIYKNILPCMLESVKLLRASAKDQEKAKTEENGRYQEILPEIGRKSREIQRFIGLHNLTIFDYYKSVR